MLWLHKFANEVHSKLDSSKPTSDLFRSSLFSHLLINRTVVYVCVCVCVCVAVCVCVCVCGCVCVCVAVCVCV